MTANRGQPRRRPILHVFQDALDAILQPLQDRGSGRIVIDLLLEPTHEVVNFPSAGPSSSRSGYRIATVALLDATPRKCVIRRHSS